MNGITEAHIVWRANLSPMKQQKSAFNSYNLFPAVNQNMENVLFTLHILHFPPSD